MLLEPRWVVIVGLASAGAAYADPFTGTQELAVKATATYGTKYPRRTFDPKLEVMITKGAGDVRTVVVRDKQYTKTYTCALPGHVDPTGLVLDPGGSCEVPVATSEFCILAADRCKAHLKHATCTGEQANWGALTGRVSVGEITDQHGTWKMTIELDVDGCVLASGHNDDAPIWVQGGRLTVGAP